MVNLMLPVVRFLRAPLCLVGLCLFALPGDSFAATLWTVDLTGNGAHDWNAGATWDGTNVDAVDAFDGVVPGVDDIAIVQRGDENNDYVYIEAANTIQRFGVGTSAAETGALEIRSGGTLTTTSSSRSDVGNDGTGFMRIFSGGTVGMAGELHVGNSGSGEGDVLVEGTLTQAQYFSLGYNADTKGTVVVNGGTNTIGQFLQVGRLGEGTYRLIDGEVNVNWVVANNYGVLICSNSSDAVGMVEVSGGTFTVADTNDGVVNGLGGSTNSTFKVIGDAATIEIGTNYEQLSGATTAFEIGTGISPINLGGDLILAGALDVAFTTTPSIGESFTLMNYGGLLSTEFETESVAGLPSGATYSLDYGTGSDSSVILSVVEIPEPATAVSLLIGALMVLLRRR